MLQRLALARQDQGVARDAELLGRDACQGWSPWDEAQARAVWYAIGMADANKGDPDVDPDREKVFEKIAREQPETLPTEMARAGRNF